VSPRLQRCSESWAEFSDLLVFIIIDAILLSELLAKAVMEAHNETSEVAMLQVVIGAIRPGDDHCIYAFGAAGNEFS
jgi:hypothetical protein